MICIYAIKNTTNGKMYIGSTVNMTARFKKHRTDLKRNSHCNTHLQNAYNLYGEGALDFIILATCGKHQLISKEKEFIEKYHSLDPTFGYNLTLPREVIARKSSEKYREVLSKAKQGITPTNFLEMQQRRWKSVDFYDAGVFIKNAPSVLTLAKDLGIDRQNIHNYLKGKVKMLRYNPRWHFEYKTEEI